LLNFVQGCEKFGRYNFEKIATHISTKTSTEVESYSKVFWLRKEELIDHNKYVRIIEKAET